MSIIHIKEILHVMNISIIESAIASGPELQTGNHNQLGWVQYKIKKLFKTIFTRAKNTYQVAVFETFIIYGFYKGIM